MTSAFRKPDFWTVVTGVILVVLVVLLLFPIVRVLMLSFVDADTLKWTLGNYVEVFTRNYYLSGLRNTLFVGIFGTLGACLLGVPLAFFTSRFRLKGRAWISTLAILVLVAPPFIGAYAWIMMLGTNDLWRARHHSCVHVKVFSIRFSDDPDGVDGSQQIFRGRCGKSWLHAVAKVRQNHASTGVSGH
jgi:ABC-type Fe3+ transport system permease subunit